MLGRNSGIVVASSVTQRRDEMDWFVYLLWGFVGGFAVATPIADWAQRMEDANDAISDTPSVGWQCALLRAKARKENHA